MNETQDLHHVPDYPLSPNGGEGEGESSILCPSFSNAMLALNSPDKNRSEIFTNPDTLEPKSAVLKMESFSKLRAICQRPGRLKLLRARSTLALIAQSST